MTQYQFQAPPLTKVNRILLIGSVSCFLVGAILKAIGAFSLVSLLGLSASGLFSGFIFQILTYPFIETELIGFLFNALLIWFMGSEIEKLWGSKIYLRFLSAVIITVGLIYTLVSTVFFFGTFLYTAQLHGLSGINFALLIAYATLYPDRQLSLMMIFPMRARTFCWILAGIEAYYAIFSSMATSWAHLLAMGISYLLIRYQTQPLIRSVLNSSFTKRKAKKGHLYVVKDDDKDPPKYWQ